MTEAHGVNNYPIGQETTLGLSVAARTDATQKPVVTITTNRPVCVEVRWAGGSERLDCNPLS